MKKIKISKLLPGLLLILLMISVATSEAARDASIYQAQNQLKESGYYSGTLDGIAGGKTKEAIKKFQKVNGISLTGALDENTKDKLGLNKIIASLFFYYSTSCPHCAWQQPQIRKFEKRHTDVDVIWRKVGTLSPFERELISGTSGHPVMVLFQGKNRSKIIGETSPEDLEKELEKFIDDSKKSKSTGAYVNSTGGSYIVCN